MTASPKIDRSFLARFGLFLLWAVAFSVSFTQWPLYTENQNTKFLIGLARAGFGVLEGDWLASTVDPLPVFSGLVWLTYRFLHQNFFYLYHALLLGVYLYSLFAIADTVFDVSKYVAGHILFGAFVVAFHSSLLPPFSTELLGTSVGWLLQSGVANQYLLNPVLQPSTFGVLLVLSIAIFLRGRPYWAVSSAAVAAIFHSTYLPSAAVLTTAYMLLTWRASGRLVEAIGIGSVGLLLVAPVLLYNYLFLGPTSSELWQKSQDLIVNFRIPHHSIPDIWIDRTTYVKGGLVLLALIVTVRSQLFVILLVAAGVALGLTWLQIRVEWNTLAFVAPWRISAFLVPVSTAMIGAFVITRVLDSLPHPSRRLQWIVGALAVTWLILMTGKGALAIQDSFEHRRNSELARLWEFGRQTKLPQQVYLVPSHMAEFRLETGLPVVVTFKSHPYKDVEVIEWRERIDAVDHFFADISCDGIREMARVYHVTHVVLERVQFFDGCPIIRNVHLDDRFGVFEVVDS